LALLWASAFGRPDVYLRQAEDALVSLPVPTFHSTITAWFGGGDPRGNQTVVSPIPVDPAPRHALVPGAASSKRGAHDSPAEAAVVDRPVLFPPVTLTETDFAGQQADQAVAVATPPPVPPSREPAHVQARAARTDQPSEGDRISTRVHNWLRKLTRFASATAQPARPGHDRPWQAGGLEGGGG